MPNPKPWYRPRNVCIAAFLILVALLAHEVYLAVNATPGKAIDYGQRAVALVEENQPKGLPADEPNSWRFLVETIDAAKAALDEAAGDGDPIEFEALYILSTENRPDGWSLENEQARARTAIDLFAARGIPDRLAKIAAARRFVRPSQRGNLIGWLLPELGGARSLARYSAARMELARQQGDWPEYVRAYDEGMALATLFSRQFTLIDALVGYAITSLMATRLSEALVTTRLDEPTLVALLAAHERRAALTPITRTLEGERLGCLDTIQWTHTDDGRGSGRIILTQVQMLSNFGGGGLNFGGASIINMGAIAFPSKRAVTRRANEFYDKVAAYAALRRADRPKSGFSPEAWVDSLSPRHVVLRMLVPAFGRAVDSWDHTQARLEGTRVMLALEIAQRRTGQYPASLAELAPAILTSVPLDPFSSGPLVYRRQEPDEAGRRYLLYSVGADGRDNNGAQHAKTRELAFRDGNNGLDYVLNEPPKPPTAKPKPDPHPDQPTQPDGTSP
ncbi:MAG: hypothetical protein JNM80_03410 [Phycisphaerae bacterium]|nr:hypothetical protein [Phycisphaerae bacterium]